MKKDDFLQEKDLKGYLFEILTREEIYWKEKVRENWLLEGDLNIKFFHVSIKSRRDRNRIDNIMNKDVNIIVVEKDI